MNDGITVLYDWSLWCPDLPSISHHTAIVYRQPKCWPRRWDPKPTTVDEMDLTSRGFGGQFSVRIPFAEAEECVVSHTCVSVPAVIIVIVLLWPVRAAPNPLVWDLLFCSFFGISHPPHHPHIVVADGASFNEKLVEV